MPRPKISHEDYQRMLDSIPEIDFARLAAYIDGEGCIVISSSQHPRGRGVSKSHCMVVTVTNTYLPLFDWITSRFGGSVVEANSSKVPPHGKRCWRWILAEVHSEMLLRRCLPYMIVKVEQAKIALAFRNIKRRKYDKFHNGPLTAEMIQQRDELQKKISDLNANSSFGLLRKRRLAADEVSQHDIVN